MTGIEKNPDGFESEKRQERGREEKRKGGEEILREKFPRRAK